MSTCDIKLGSKFFKRSRYQGPETRLFIFFLNEKLFKQRHLGIKSYPIQFMPNHVCTPIFKFLITPKYIYIRSFILSREREYYSKLNNRTLPRINWVWVRVTNQIPWLKSLYYHRINTLIDFFMKKKLSSFSWKALCSN